MPRVSPRLATLLLASLASTGTVASANNVVATDLEPAAPSPHHVDGRLGLLLGGADVGDADGFSIGVGAAAGYRIGDLTIRGTFDYYRVGDGAGEVLDRRGRATRLGGTLRYSFVNNASPRKGFGVDFWGELGGGWEHVAWRAGGVLDRPSAEVGAGVDLGGRGKRDAAGHQREVGYFLAFRTLIGNAPERTDLMPTCGGPCTQATRPSRTDVTMFFELGVHWGR